MYIYTLVVHGEEGEVMPPVVFGTLIDIQEYVVNYPEKVKASYDWRDTKEELDKFVSNMHRDCQLLIDSLHFNMDSYDMDMISRGETWIFTRHEISHTD